MSEVFFDRKLSRESDSDEPKNSNGGPIDTNPLFARGSGNFDKADLCVRDVTNLAYLIRCCRKSTETDWNEQGHVTDFANGNTLTPRAIANAGYSTLGID